MRMSILGFETTKRFAAVAILASFVLSNVFAVTAQRSSLRSVSSATTKYTTDLTQLGREGRLRENLSFENETDRLIKVLAEGGVRQPVIIDNDNATQETVVEQLAIRIAKGSVQKELAGKSIIKIETDILFSNARTAAAVARIVNPIVRDAVASKGQTILFVNDVTDLVGLRAATTNLFEAIAAGKLVMIGGSSAAAYDEQIGSQPELVAYFEGILISGSSTASARLDAVREDKDETYRGDNVSPDLREMMANDPSGNTRVDVILQAKDADNPALRSLMANGQARISDRIGSTDTLVVNLPLSAVSSLSESGLINYVSPDRPTTSMGHVEDTTGATQMRSNSNGGCISSLESCDGTNVGIAIVDSGIYSSHNGFKDSSGNSRIVANVNFSSSSSTNDNFGHGTHVAGLAAGNSSTSGGAYRGVARDADIISVKVLNDTGTGTTSGLLNGLNWILNNRNTYKIKVVNLSLGTTAIDTYTNDPICLKVKELVSAGIVVFAAAGNEGKDLVTGSKVYGGIHSPGNSPYVITVGASNSMGTTSHQDDVMTTYSSNGPTRSYFTTSTGTKVYDNVIKPDLVAPGNKLVSYKAPNNYLVTQSPSLALDLTNGTNSNMYMSGTSMSTPLAAGAAAMLLEINPELTPGMIGMILQYTAQPMNGRNTFEQGAGQLNIDGAMRLARTLKTDVDFQGLSRGNSMVPSGWSMPSTSSTIGGWSFPWAQFITGKYTLVSGSNLVSQFQTVYKNANIVGQGINFSNGNYSLNTTYFTSGLTLNRNINTSNGASLGAGTNFLQYGVLVGDGNPAGDGVLVGDAAIRKGGVLVGDGVIVGDGVMRRGGVLVGDSVITGDNIVSGDNTPHM